MFLLSPHQALVWESVGLMAGQLYTEVSVVFKNVQFHRATNIPKEGVYISILIRVACLEIISHILSLEVNLCTSTLYGIFVSLVNFFCDFD